LLHLVGNFGGANAAASPEKIGRTGLKNILSVFFVPRAVRSRDGIEIGECEILHDPVRSFIHVHADSQ
jgi:hypothetical protein